MEAGRATDGATIAEANREDETIDATPGDTESDKDPIDETDVNVAGVRLVVGKDGKFSHRGPTQKG